MTPDIKRYSLTNIRFGIQYFLLGKAFTVISGFIYLILVVRNLSIDEYAAYVTFFAFITFISMISGLGIPQVILRFVPELYAAGKDRLLKEFFWVLFVVRFTSLLFFVILIFIFSPKIAELFKFTDYLFEFKIYLFIILVRVSSLLLFQSLESTLKQKIAQIGIGVSSLLKVSFFSSYILLYDKVKLIDIIYIEIISDFISLIFLTFWNMTFFRTLDPDMTRSDDNYLENKNKFIKRIVGYGKVQYMQHIVMSMYGSASNKLIASHFLTPFNIGLFGFAQVLNDFFTRFLPLQLLIGIIRPVFTARYSSNNDFSELVVYSNVVYKINFIIIVLVMSVVYTCGDEIFLLITDGKFGHMVSILFLVFLFNLLLYSAILSLDILLQVTEKTKIMIYSNMILSLSSIISILLISKVGILIIPIANAFGLVLSLLLVLWWLKQCGLEFKFDIQPLEKIILSGMLSSVLVILLDSSLWGLSLVLTIIFFFMFNFLLKSFNQNDIYFINKLMIAKRAKKA